jgi:hypothetical protein
MDYDTQGYCICETTKVNAIVKMAEMATKDAERTKPSHDKPLSTCRKWRANINLDL